MAEIKVDDEIASDPLYPSAVKALEAYGLPDTLAQQVLALTQARGGHFPLLTDAAEAMARDIENMY